MKLVSGNLTSNIVFIKILLSHCDMCQELARAVNILYYYIYLTESGSVAAHYWQIMTETIDYQFPSHTKIPIPH